MTAPFLAGSTTMPRPPAVARYVAIAMLGAVLLLALALWFGDETRDLNTMRGLARASYENRIEATDLLRRLGEAETAQRGFVITGQPAFLAAFDGAHEDVDASLAWLDTRLARSSGQHARVAYLRTLIRAKFAEMAGVVALRRQRGFAPAAAVVASGEGVRLMSAARAVVGAMIAAERGSLAAQLAAILSRYRFLQYAVWGFGSVIGALLLIGPAILWRSRRARFAVECEAYEATLRLRAVFDSTGEAIVILSADGRIAASNDVTARMLGYRSSELAGMAALRLLGINQGARSFAEIVGIADGHATRTMWLDRMIRHKDGHKVPVDIALGAMQLRDQLHFVATLRDISERRAAERLKDEFIATVSHELRTPLTSVVGSLGLLRAGAVGELPDAARRLVNIAENNSQRLIGLINDILDIEKIGSGRMHFESRPLDLDRVAREAVEGSRGLAEAKAVRLAWIPSETATIVDGDADRLTQVVINLLSNAIRFSPAQGTVRIVVTRAAAEAILSIEDEGPGVPAAFVPRIFERFSQAADGNVTGGTGLGLAISREIVKAQGGRIWFDKAAGGGARFSFALPLAIVAPFAAGRRPARLLVCENQPDVADVLRRLIEAEGCTVDCVTTARDLEAAACTGRYDGIVLDLVLPDVDGLDAVRRLRRRAETRTTPIVVVSAFAGIGEADPAAAALDVIDWIAKPVDRERLILAVGRAIDHAAIGRPTLLHIDDDIDMLEVTATALADQGRMLCATSLAAARALLAEAMPDIVILDLGLPDGSGLTLLPELFTIDGIAVPTIIYSAEDVVPAVKRQVDAVIVKSRRSLPSLAGTIRHLLETAGCVSGRSEAAR